VGASNHRLLQISSFLGLKSLYFLWFFVLPFLASNSFALSVDKYVGPFGSMAYPIYSQENSFNSPVIPSSLRPGFRIESGSISDHVSVDFRFNSRSQYIDYGLVFRGFLCSGVESSVALCGGLGVGGAYSPGFTADPPGRNFFDLLVNPFGRVLMDFGPQSAFVFDVGILTVPTRTFSTDDPVDQDSKAKIRIDVAAGIALDFIELGSGFGFGQSAAAFDSSERRMAMFGVKGGFPISKYTGTDSSGDALDGESRTGLLGGLTLDIGQAEWGLMIDAFYAARRFGISTSSSAVLERIELPVNLRYRSAGTGFFMGSLGGFFALPMGNATVVTGTNNVEVSNVSYNSDYGWSAGLGFGTQAEATTVTLELRLSFGLAELLTNPAGAEKTKSRFYDLLIGFLF
jgi:hypothetical protein